jgi:hypothetical protein
MRIAYIILCAVGGAMLLAGVATALDTRAFLGRAVHTRGTVVGFEQRADEDDANEIYFYPRFQFVTSTGAAWTVVAGAGTNRPGYRVGQSVEVLYDPTNAQDARIETFFQLWFLPMVLAAIGALCAIVAWATARWQRRRGTDAPAAS